MVKQNQHTSVQAPNMLSSPGLPMRLQDSVSGQPQPPWPRMTQTDVQKYTKVDTDRDEKITGEQVEELVSLLEITKRYILYFLSCSDCNFSVVSSFTDNFLLAVFYIFQRF